MNFSVVLERSWSGDARVINEHGELGRCRSREQRLDAGSRREIGDERLEPAAAGADLIGEGAQPLAATRHR
jgi:hypothetical protein